jgi:hypothetical protein
MCGCGIESYDQWQELTNTVLNTVFPQHWGKFLTNYQNRSNEFIPRNRYIKSKSLYIGNNVAVCAGQFRTMFPTQPFSEHR